LRRRGKDGREKEEEERRSSGKMLRCRPTVELSVPWDDLTRCRPTKGRGE
jgi:hypothetical protein